MILFHGSNIDIQEIDVSRGQKFKDFGQGFYTTPIRQQAESWANRIALTFGGEPVVNRFEFDLDKAVNDGLKVLIFDEPSPEWALFVMANRNTDNETVHEYDIVIGPVADDKMVRLFSLYRQEFINLEAVVEGLKYKGLNSQYFFGTQRSIKYLHKL